MGRWYSAAFSSTEHMVLSTPFENKFDVNRWSSEKTGCGSGESPLARESGVLRWRVLLETLQQPLLALLGCISPRT